jgi:agmatinase
MIMKTTFAGIPEALSFKETASIYLQSIPYDGTSTWGKGADKGFTEFLTAAENMELYDIETDSEVFRKGIHILDPAPTFKSPEEMYQYTLHNTQQLLKEGKFLTFFGGEHSISIGIIKAHYQYFENLSILQIDAHADLRPEYDDTPYNHACAVYDASRNSHLVQVGIRSMDIEEKQYEQDGNVFYAHKIQQNPDWIEKVVSRLKENVYITFDLDALDPSIMPATGTPEPGGLDWYQTMGLLKEVFSTKNVVGFDIVELAPIDGMHAPQFLAAKLYYKMLSYKFKDNE